VGKRQKEHNGECKFDFVDREKLVCTMNTNHWIIVAHDRRQAILLELLQLDRLTRQAKKEALSLQECLPDVVGLKEDSSKFVEITGVKKDYDNEDNKFDEWDF
jgi:hypothetical protein